MTDAATDLRLIELSAYRLICKLAPEPGDDDETRMERYAMVLELRRVANQASAALVSEVTPEDQERAREAAIAALQRLNSRIDVATFRVSLSPSAEVH